MIEVTQWKIFTIGDVFDLVSKYGDVENVRELSKGSTRYISTSKYNNGLYRRVTNIDYAVEKENCITVGIDGSFSVFYQPFPFIRTTNIAVLRSHKLNKYNALFLITIIRIAVSKYYYGVKLKSTDLLINNPLLLPTVNEKQPDWNFMTEYIRDMYIKLSKKYETSICAPTTSLDFTKWKRVKLTDIFDYRRGQRYIKENQIKGFHPYIASSEYNNGVDGYVSPSPRSVIFRDALTIANSGSRGVVFYHDGEFVASDHVTVLWLKSGEKLNKKRGLFLKPIIEKNAARYLFNKEINKKTILEIELFLPYNNNKPDWEFMEKYINTIPYSDKI